MFYPGAQADINSRVGLLEKNLNAPRPSYRAAIVQQQIVKVVHYLEAFLQEFMKMIHAQNVRGISCACEQQQGTIPSMFAVCNVDYILIVDISSSDRIAREPFFRFLEHRF